MLLLPVSCPTKAGDPSGSNCRTFWREIVICWSPHSTQQKTSGSDTQHRQLATPWGPNLPFQAKIPEPFNGLHPCKLRTSRDIHNITEPGKSNSSRLHGRFSSLNMQRRILVTSQLTSLFDTRTPCESAPFHWLLSVAQETRAVIVGSHGEFM